MNRKSSLGVMIMEGVSMVTKILHLSSTAGNTAMSPFNPYAYLIMPTMWNFSWQKNHFLMRLCSSSCRRTNQSVEIVIVVRKRSGISSNWREMGERLWRALSDW